VFVEPAPKAAASKTPGQVSLSHIFTMRRRPIFFLFLSRVLFIALSKYRPTCIIRKLTRRSKFSPPLESFPAAALFRQGDQKLMNCRLISILFTAAKSFRRGVDFLYVQSIITKIILLFLLPCVYFWHFLRIIVFCLI